MSNFKSSILSLHICLMYLDVSPLWLTILSWWRGLLNSMKLLDMPCRVTQDGQAIVGNYEQTWSTGEGKGKPFRHSCLKNPMNSMKQQKVWYQKMSLQGKNVFNTLLGKSERVITKRSRKNEEAESKQKWCSVVDVSNGKCKVWCFKEHYCIGTWYIGSMNQSKLDAVKQEMARVNIGILGISELNRRGMGKF